jgi:glycosyltransferase involved in cell wall biosynthesis
VRVLVASGTWYPERNGVARVATEVSQSLAARGHEVIALAPRLADLPAEEHKDSVVVHRKIERGHLPLLITDVLETTKHARRLGFFDVLLAHGSAAAVGLSQAGVEAPLVFVYHASGPRELRFLRVRLPWGRKRLVAYLNEPINVTLQKIAARRCDRILILSEYSRSLVMADHPRQSSKIRAAPGGVDTRSFRPADGVLAARGRLGLDSGQRLLLTVRRAEPRMGLEQLLRAIRLRPADNLALAIVGGGLLTDELRRLSLELGLGGRVRFVGAVGEEALRDWYRAADLFVLPTVAYEGFGMVTLEALASGTPVVGTAVGATPELLEPLDPRLVARGSDPESLARTIDEALAFVDDGFRARCRDYTVTRFDWNEVARAWEDVLFDAARS